MAMARRVTGLTTLAAIAVMVMALPGSAASQSRKGQGKCFLEVGNKIWFDGPCSFEQDEAGSYTWNASPRSNRPTLFVYVNLQDDNVLADGFWSGPDPRSTHAHSVIANDMKKVGDCWVGPTGRTCISMRR